MKQFTPPPAPEQTYVKGGQLADAGTVFCITKVQERRHPTYGEMLDFVIVQIDKPVPNTKLHGILSLTKDESREEIVAQLDGEPLGPCGIEKVGNYLRIVDRPQKKGYDKALKAALDQMAADAPNGDDEDSPF